MKQIFSLLSIFTAIVLAQHSSYAQEAEGVLILAHGSVMGHFMGEYPSNKSQCEIVREHGNVNGQHQWENAICQVVDEVNRIKKVQIPVEVAFGMTTLESFQHAVDRLASAGMNKLRVIPLYISSHSDVIRIQREMFGVSSAAQGFREKVIIPKAVTKVIYEDALDQAEEMSRALITRAQEMSRNPYFEELILVGHGPLRFEDDQLWVRDFNVHGGRIQEYFEKGNGRFNAVHAITVQDDAPEDVREEKTRQLRRLVTEGIKRGNRVLVLPVLIARGSIENGIERRLRGLDYTFSRHMLTPDHNITAWINAKIMRN